MTNFWQDNVLADEFNAPSAPAPVMNLQNLQGINTFPQDATTFCQSGLSVSLSGGSPSYVVTIPCINVTRSGAATSLSVYALLGPATAADNVYFDIEWQVKNASGTVVSTITQPSSSWGYAGQARTSDNSLMYLYTANTASNWPPGSILPSGASGSVVFTMTLNSTHSGSLTACTLIGLVFA
jgi:hypothetical protein